LVNFGYEGTVLHLTDVTVPATASRVSRSRSRPDVTWLVCADICVPEEAQLELDIPVNRRCTSARTCRRRFRRDAGQAPRAEPVPAVFQADATHFSLALDSPEIAKAAPASVVLFPSQGGFIKNAAPQSVEIRDNGLVVSTEDGRHFSTPERAAKATLLPAVLVITGTDGRTQALTVSAEPGVVASDGQGLSVWVAIAYALLGGLILNLMPCVFPVLSIKALSLAGKGGDHRGARISALAYTAGVVLSFVALAGALIALREAGQAIGWGFQLQSPVVVAALALLFFVIGLNLMGVFEVGGRLQNLGSGVTAKEGPTASFMTGVLAAVVAAPCTAPFMAGAVGTAIAQPAPVALTIFAALGLGMALPFAVLACWPALIRALPKPGPWMERLKQVLAFPMFASAVWLMWVLTLQAGANAVALVLGAMVAAAFALWLWALSSADRADGSPAAPPCWRRVSPSLPSSSCRRPRSAPARRRAARPAGRSRRPMRLRVSMRCWPKASPSSSI
jgi:thiol:disulfide interchange protein DsbD